ncbi:MAG TPA: hypothetical protein DCP92_19365 [Nitrospiraceae bacterium]|nr:hypothetical protein [Nitrospiraceae bacterium]
MRNGNRQFEAELNPNAYVLKKHSIKSSTRSPHGLPMSTVRHMPEPFTHFGKTWSKFFKDIKAG